MAFRKLLLRVMLWSLALAAVCGVLAVLFSAHETAWRVVGDDGDDGRGGRADDVDERSIREAAHTRGGIPGDGDGGDGVDACRSPDLGYPSSIWIGLPFRGERGNEHGVWRRDGHVGDAGADMA